MIISNRALKKPFYTAVGLHVGIALLLLIGGLIWHETAFKQQPVNIVNASTVTQTVRPEPKVIHHRVMKHEKTHAKRSIVKHEAVHHTVIKKAEVRRKEHLRKHHHHDTTRAQRLAAQHKLAEAKRLKAEHAKAIHNILARYQAMILQSISQHWLIPPGIDKHLSCKLYIQLAPDGAVLNASIVSSSGNVMLDRSAIAAVYKASPLPVPSKPDLFKPFKNITLIVRPEDVLS